MVFEEKDEEWFEECKEFLEKGSKVLFVRVYVKPGEVKFSDINRLLRMNGYKGKIIGGAQVSLKHANFIVNCGGATGEDIVTLISEIKDIVKEKYNVNLVLEQEIVE